MDVWGVGEVAGGQKKKGNQDMCVIPYYNPAFGNIQIRDEKGRLVSMISPGRRDIKNVSASGSCIYVESTSMIDVYDCSSGRANLVSSFGKR